MPFSPAAGSTILADASALVYLVEEPEASPRRRVVERYVHSGAKVIASVIIWAELISKPNAAGDRDLATRYRALLADSSRIELAVVDVAVAERAAALFASIRPSIRRKFSQSDLIHVATAIELRAGAILTNDGAWREIPSCPQLLVVDELALDEKGA